MSHPSQLLGACFVLVACSGAAGVDGGTPGNSAGASGATGTAGQSAAGSTTAGGPSETAGSPSANGGTTTLGGAAGTAGDGERGGDVTASGTGGGAGTAGKGPGNAPIDYSVWQLQLPIGSGTSPTTVSSAELLAGFSNEYFYVAPDGGQMFMDPATGVTTSGSQHCRTEMRELTAAGAQAAWALSGTNTLTVEGKVTLVGGGSKGNVTVAQVFNGSGSAPLCELEYSVSKGGFQLLYEEAKGNGTTVDLKTPVALSARYAFVLSLSQGVLDVSINGKQVYEHTPSASLAANQFYFKFGNYDQSAAAGAISTTPYTIVEAYSAKIVHE
jgi:Alginate lyase